MQHTAVAFKFLKQVLQTLHLPKGRFRPQI